MKAAGNERITLYDIHDCMDFAVNYLWGLLLQREPEQNISHDGQTTYAQHEAFLRGDNDRAHWYIIACESITPAGQTGIGAREGTLIPVGTIYLTSRNEIGIQITKSDQRKGYARAAVEALMGRHPLPYYLANVAPGNEPSHAFWRALPGSKVIQHTYRITRGEDHA